jgi:hypothetical protein
MKRPFKSIKILGKHHRVNWGIDLDGDCGQIDEVKNLIEISDGMGAHEERETVLHEIVHAVAHQLGVKMPEKKVRPMSCGIYEVLMNNPKLTAYLFEQGNEDDAD